MWRQFHPLLGWRELHRPGRYRVRGRHANAVRHEDDSLLARANPQGGYREDREGHRLVHMIRDPFELVASYHQFHRAGNERGRGYWSESDYQHLLHSSLQEGVLYVAHRVIVQQLPLMAAVHKALRRHTSEPHGTISASSSRVLVIRMESTLQSFGESMQRLSRFVGLPQRCSPPCRLRTRRVAS
eukprot:5992912-Prymnesium_polylepis.2